MSRPLLLLACAAFLRGVSAQAEASTPASKLTAPDILQRMAATYAGCRSYRDAGVVQNTFTSKGEGSAAGALDHAGRVTHSSLAFRTVFVRPGKFRFEYTQGSFGRLHRFIIWEDGADVRTWWDIKPGVERVGSLMRAIAGGTGISSGSAHTVPRMLMPLQIGGAVLATDLAQPERLPDESLDDVPCFVVKGHFVDSERTIWLDQQSFLVRQMHSLTEIETATLEDTTVYEPEIDVDIGPGELLFAPPSAQEQKQEQEAEERASHPARKPLPFEEEFEPRFDHARKLVESQDLDAALVEFEWLWDATNNLGSAFEPAIRPTIVKAIGELAAQHAATREHFTAIFEDLDAKVRANTPPVFRYWTDWADLGRALKLDDRILKLYLERRSQSGAIRTFTDFHPYAYDDLLDILIERRQYADAGRLCADPVNEAERAYGVDSRLSADNASDLNSALAEMRGYDRTRLSQLYALTLAADRSDEAAGVARILLANDDSVAARRELILACLKFEVSPDTLHIWMAEIRARGGDVSDLEALMAAPSSEAPADGH
jgi:hypothetical protein